MTATYTMNDFINNKLAVRVNKDNILDFLKMCEEKGLVWASGEKATDFVPSTAKCIAFGLVSENTLTYSCDDESTIYAADGYTFVDFSQIFPTKYQIIIESNGDTTTAKMVVNGKKVKTATAKRNPADKPNWHIGAQTAFDRLWEKKEKPEKPMEKHGFKVGDRVVCVSDHFCAPNSVGQHGRIVMFDGSCDIGVEFDECQPGGHDCCGKTKSEHGRWLIASNLRHEQPTKPEVREVKRKANAGEWVKIVNAENIWGEIYKNGDILQVKSTYIDGTAILSCGGFCAFPSEYVVLEGYQP